MTQQGHEDTSPAQAVKEQKAALRRRILRERQAMTAGERETKSAQLRAHFLAWFAEFQQSQTTDPASPLEVGLYSAIRGEADVLPLRLPLEAWDAAAVLPKTNVARRQIEFYRVHAGEDLVPGAYGILEPRASAKAVDPAHIRILLIPALAYSLNGTRLGYGGGYYDRFLADAKVRAIRIGVTFSTQLVSELPTQAHDEPVDYVLSDEGLTQCLKDR